MSTSFISYSEDHTSSAESVSASVPGSVNDDDLLVAIIGFASGRSIDTAPSGWTLRGSQSSNYFHLYTKVASSEWGPYTWEWTTATSARVTIAAYRDGFDTADPIDAVSNTGYTTFNTTLRAASFSVTDTDSTLIFVGGVRNPTSTTFTEPSNPGSFAEDIDAGDADSDQWHTFAHYEWSGSGATGNIDGTLSTSLTGKHAFCISLTPGGIDYSATPDGMSFNYTFGAVGASIGRVATPAGMSFEYTFGDVEAEVKRFKSTTFRDIVENGGGNLAFLWHVSGYPWAVTDNADLITALSDTEDATVQTARKRLFGLNEFTLDTAITPAYSVPIFPGLQRDFGKIKISMDESKGLPQGGDWSVKIEDRTHGHTWDHAVVGDEIWGLEGLHRVARVKDSSIHGWGYLAANFLISTGGFPGELDIEEESGTRLYDRLDGFTGDEWCPIWINDECVAAYDVDTADNGYQIVMQDATPGSSRGLYRSRVADHFTAVLKGINPIVADVPGGVAGKACWLYAIPLHEGALMLRSDGSPIIAEVASGVISPNISTKDGITKVSISSALKTLDRTVNIERSRATEMSLAGYVFSRGESGSTGGSTLGSDIVDYVQAPHLTIREFGANFSAMKSEIEARYAAGESWNDYLGNPDYYNYAHIWLCGKNETIVFETIEDVIDAINNELEACYNDTFGRNSEDTVLVHRHQVLWGKDKDYLSLHSLDDSDENRQFMIDNSVSPDYVDKALYSKFTGPVAWAFFLGSAIDLDNNIYTAIQKDRKYYQLLDTVIDMDLNMHVYPFDKNSERYWLEERGDVLDVLTDDTDVVGGVENLGRASISGNTSGLLPLYFYNWCYEENSLNNDYVDEYEIPTSELWRGTGVFYLPPGTDLNTFVEGENLTLGDGRRFPRLNFEVTTLEDSDEYSLKELTIGSVSVETGKNIMSGSSLFCLPLLEHWRRDDVGDNEELDAHLIHKEYDLKSNTLSDVMRKILGDNDVTSVGIAKELQQTSNPFFTTIAAEGLISQIDWESLDDLPKLNGIYYDMPLKNTASISKILKGEILFHCAHMTYEWDDSDQTWKYRFREISPPNKSIAWSLGYRLTAGKCLEGAPVESHGDTDLFNAIEFTIGSTSGDKDYNFSFEQVNANIVGTDERRTLPINPVISVVKPATFGGRNSFKSNDLIKHFVHLLDVISKPPIIQEKGTGTLQWLFPVGREILVTDALARTPYTHTLGLATEPALVVGMSFDIAKQKGTISYRLYGPTEGEVTGYAPACYLSTGNFSKEVGYFYGTPDSHVFTASYQADDVYFFDCLDLRDPDNPRARDCSCDEYKVWVHEEGAYNDTPLEFTCAVNANTGVITLTGDTTDIDTGKNYFVTFREWADLEDCQKIWCTHGDDNNTIGSANAPAHRWV